MKKKLKIQTWYEQLGYKNNPFSIKPSQGKLMGLTKLRKDVIETIKEGHTIILEGDYGNGKTSFLKNIIRPFGGQKKVIYFSCNRLVSKLDIDELLYDRFGLITKMLKIKSKEMIMLLDEAEYLSKEDFKTINTYYKNRYLKSVVYVTHDIKILKITKPHLKKTVQFSFLGLEPKEVVKIIRNRIGETPLMTDAVIVKIYEMDKRMRFFLKNCELFMRQMVQTNRKTAKPSDVKKILKKALDFN